MEVKNGSEVKKSKRLTSVVWNHFERVSKGEVCHAVCVHCNKRLSGSSNSGTTHLRNHLMRCLKRSNFDVSQLLAKKRKKEGTISLPITNTNFVDVQRKDEYIQVQPIAVVKFDQEARKEEFMNLGSSKFDQERSRLDLARMIILHGYPVDMTGHVGFKVFVKNLQPLFEVMPDSEVEISCIEIYFKEKRKVYETIKNFQGRINLTVETWSSPEKNAEYLCLTAHHIDGDWRVHRKILNFLTLEPSHTQDKLSEIIVKCLVEWDIDSKLFAVSFDNCSIDDGIMTRVKDQISQNRPRASSGQLYDIRCAAHLLNSVVRDAMEALREVTRKIRESIGHVKSSQVTQAKFNEISRQVGIDSQRSLALDCPNRWNSTFSMLEAALEYRGAFSVLQEHDLIFKSALTDAEWDWVSSVTGYLRLFADVTKIFSAGESPENVYFPEICDVHLLLIERCKSTDGFICSMALKMKAKFDKFWNKCSLVLAMKAILDPRFKMKLVEYYYSQIYGSTALDRIKEVSDGIRELFNSYSFCSTLVDQDSALPSTSCDARDRLKGFDKFLHETSQVQSVAPDLDKYLEEPIFPRNCDFSILNWWKVHAPQYPVLSVMARDVLGTPFSTVAPESAFSTGGRVLDHKRSSLNPETREALICSQDWLRTELGELNHSALSFFAERLDS